MIKITNFLMILIKTTSKIGGFAFGFLTSTYVFGKYKRIHWVFEYDLQYRIYIYAHYF